ncbi:MAG: hypothetical protein RMK18_01280 [Armatimonadota bacterium]|nr:hypothetical protein [Armatimonadota bacterium]MCX7778221.1 hypothetical protein [Armatimonadota bacterium]MDW8024487.1 hypothetical protein [Armatimonadota bacterium]
MSKVSMNLIESFPDEKPNGVSTTNYVRQDCWRAEHSLLCLIRVSKKLLCACCVVCRP